jgi:hypothetical protein
MGEKRASTTQQLKQRQEKKEVLVISDSPSELATPIASVVVDGEVQYITDTQANGVNIIKPESKKNVIF